MCDCCLYDLFSYSRLALDPRTVRDDLATWIQLDLWSWDYQYQRGHLCYYFDPDNLIAERGLGKVGKDVSKLAVRIREL